MARFVFMVLDGVGVGALPDAADYGDTGSNTLGNLAALVDLELPNLRALGLGNILPLRTVPPVDRPLALPGRLAESSRGKDTTTGHWEHMGIITESPLRTYPNGFPPDVLEPLEERIGRGVLGNKAASGTEIIAELGEEHLRTREPIVYTSADSVFQIAAHVDVTPLEQLYEWCRIARELLQGPHAVGRVIARPFEGRPGSFVRTKDRKDFSLEPPQRTYLDLLAESGVPTIGLGKIFQIYAGRGVAEEHKVSSNDDNLHKLLALLGEGRQGLIMTNLVDFDMTWGHRNDLEGFAGGLVAVDRALPRIVELLRPEDRLLITADHGVDPTTVSTDHSREYVPLLYYPRPAQAPDACYEGYMCDTGASAYAHLAGAQASLPGAPVERLQPARGWRRYPPVLPGECGLPCAAGPEEAQKAAVYIGSRLGPAPGVAVILGSGLDVFVHALAVEGEVEYADVPGWPSSAVVGHRGSLLVGELNGTRLAVLRGRSHAYEGPDRSELQLAVRTLVRWGVRMLVLTNASGGLDPDLAPGSLLTVERILDFQLPASDGHPAVWDCGNPRVAGVLAELPRVVYAALPGPQYETAAEVDVLRGLGADVVGMSTAAEAAAALDEGLDLTVLSVVTNPAGRTASGRDEVHREVLDVGLAAAPRLAAVLEGLIGALER